MRRVGYVDLGRIAMPEGNDGTPIPRYELCERLDVNDFRFT